MYCVETGAMLTLDAAHCGFGYRESVFKHSLKGRVVITAVELLLHRTPRPKLGYGDVEREVEARGGATLRNIREAVCAIRRAKLPRPRGAGQRGQFLQEPGRRGGHCRTAAGPNFPTSPPLPPPRKAA